MTVNGGGGIPIAGREVEYATELWLDSPSAFWLHPEGPLSDTTPDEWRAKQAKEEAERKAAWAQNPLAGLANAGMIQSGLAAQLMQAQMTQSHYLLLQAKQQQAQHIGNMFNAFLPRL